MGKAQEVFHTLEGVAVAEPRGELHPVLQVAHRLGGILQAQGSLSRQVVGFLQLGSLQKVGGLVAVVAVWQHLVQHLAGLRRVPGLDEQFGMKQLNVYLLQVHNVLVNDSRSASSTADPAGHGLEVGRGKIRGVGVQQHARRHIEPGGHALQGL